MWEEREKKAIFEIFSQQPCSELYSPVSLVDIEPRERDDVTVLRAQCEAAQTGCEMTTDPSAVKMSEGDSQVGALSQLHIFSTSLIIIIHSSAQLNNNYTTYQLDKRTLCLYCFLLFLCNIL